MAAMGSAALAGAAVGAGRLADDELTVMEDGDTPAAGRKVMGRLRREEEGGGGVELRKFFNRVTSRQRTCSNCGSQGELLEARCAAARYRCVRAVEPDSVAAR